MARLDQLGPAKFVAQLASAIGREFSYPLLEAIAPLPPERLREGLQALEHAGLVHARTVARSARATPSSTRWCRRSPIRRCCAAGGASCTRGSRRCWRSSSRRRRAMRRSWSRTTGPRRATPSGRSPAGSPPGSAPASARSIAKRSAICARASSSLPSSPIPAERRDQELALLLALGPVLIMAEGAGTPEVARLYARALELCADLPKSRLHFAAHWGWWRASMDHRAGRERADELLELAQELGDPALLAAGASLPVGDALHARRARRVLPPHRGGPRALRSGAASLARRSLRRPRRQGLRAGRAGAFVLAARTAGRGPRARAFRARVGGGAVARGQPRARDGLRARWCTGFGGTRPRWRAARTSSSPSRPSSTCAIIAPRATLFRGWARALLGDVAGGLSEMRDALAWEQEAGTPEDFPLYYEMLAEVCARAGRFEEGLDAVSKGFAQAERGGLVFWNAELHRRRGELLLAAGGDRARRRCLLRGRAAVRAGPGRAAARASRRGQPRPAPPRARDEASEAASILRTASTRASRRASTRPTSSRRGSSSRPYADDFGGGDGCVVAARAAP